MSTPSYLRYANQGATRNLPLDPRLVSSLAFLGDMGITAEVYSGGQPAKGSGGKRVGSTRHDHGNAADVRFFRGDQQLDWARDSDRPFFEDIVRRGREAGITGFGAGPGYMAPGTMHIGFGAPGVWGAGGRAANAPDWLRNAYDGASAGPSAMALGPEPSPSGAASALQSVMADRSSPSPSSPPAGGSMAAPTINIGLKPERSTKLYDVMLERAMAAGSRSRNAWDVAGNLAQVWAANSEKAEAEAENASSLQEALAGLDPEYAAAAQLTGTREGAAQAFLSQAGDRREAARRAEDMARRQEETAYQRGRDTVADQQWQAEQERLSQGTIPAGYRRTAEGMEAIPGGPADVPSETFRQATPEQAAQYGATGGQFGPDGRFYPINPPSGMSVETMPDGTMRMIQGPGAGKAMAAIESYAIDSMRKAAMGDDGVLDAAKVDRWRRAHSDALRAFPELEIRIQDAASASETAAQFATARKKAVDDAQRGAIGRLIGVEDPQDVSRIVGGLFGRQDSVQQLGQLRRAIGNDQEALQGLRRATADFLSSRLMTNTEAATSGQTLISADQMQTFVRQNKAALRTVFSAEEVTTLEAVAADLQRANRSLTAVRIPGQSNTVQDALSVTSGDTSTSILGKLMAASMASGGALAGLGVQGGGTGAVLGAGAGALIGALRQSGIQRVDELVTDALLNPNRARMLLAKVPSNNAKRESDMMASLARRYARAAVASAAVADGSGDTQRPREMLQVDVPARRPASLQEALADRGTPMRQPSRLEEAMMMRRGR